MKLTNAEKLILAMLADLHEKFEINEINTKLLKNAIHSDNTWALSWEMPRIVGNFPEPTPPDVSMVIDILDMWFFIEEAYDSLNSTQKAELNAKTSPCGKAVKFLGFDGSNETAFMKIAMFLVNDMQRFSRFAGRDLNSHCPVIDGYYRMLAKFRQIRSQLDGRDLSMTELVDILSARC